MKAGQVYYDEELSAWIIVAKDAAKTEAHSDPNDPCSDCVYDIAQDCNGRPCDSYSNIHFRLATAEELASYASKIKYVPCRPLPEKTIIPTPARKLQLTSHNANADPKIGEKGS